MSVCVCVCARANFKGYGEKALTSEAVAQRSSVKKVFLEIWQNSQEDICARVPFFIKNEALGLRRKAPVPESIY